MPSLRDDDALGQPLLETERSKQRTLSEHSGFREFGRKVYDKPILITIPSAAKDVPYYCEVDCNPNKPMPIKPPVLKARNKLIAAAICVVIFMIIELVGGILANSLAILTDAAHMFSDLAAFLISIGALLLTTRAPSKKLSFGWARAEILGVLASILLIWALTGALIFEAIDRVQHPEDVNGPIVFGVATAGLMFNLIIVRVLTGSGHGHSHGGGGGHSHGGHGHSHGHGQAHKDSHEAITKRAAMTASKSRTSTRHRTTRNRR